MYMYNVSTPVHQYVHVHVQYTCTCTMYIYMYIAHVQCTQYLLDIKGFGFECRDVDFLVSLLGLSERAPGQLAPFVGHEMAPLVEYQVLQVQSLA